MAVNYNANGEIIDQQPIDYAAAGVVPPQPAPAPQAPPSIADFASVFGGMPARPLAPSVPIKTGRFILQSCEPWFKLLKDEATGKWHRDDQMTFDETGTRVRCELRFVYTDENGIGTAADSPLVYDRLFFTADDVRKLGAIVGAPVEVVNPRIEFHAKAKKTKSGYAFIESVLEFECDDVAL